MREMLVPAAEQQIIAHHTGDVFRERFEPEFLPARSSIFSISSFVSVSLFTNAEEQCSVSVYLFDGHSAPLLRVRRTVY
jgi:hypothetical protein